MQTGSVGNYTTCRTHVVHVGVSLVVPRSTGCFKKVAPLKLFGIFSFWFSLFA